MHMSFLDYVFYGVTIVVALVITVNVLRVSESVRTKREYKRRLKNAQEFTRRLREQLGNEDGVQGDTQSATPDAD